MAETQTDVLIELLGDFRVHVGTRVVPAESFATRRALELVQLLSLEPRHRLVADQAVEALWPHLTADAGRANLRKAAHHARRALGDPDAVVLRGATVQLFPTRTVATDVEEFERTATRALTTADPGACAAAIEPRPGDLLPGTPYEEWTFRPREHVRALVRELLECCERWAELAEVEPVHEPAYQALMREALAAGRRADALRWYGRLRTRLAQDLGVAPSSVSEALHAACIEAIEPPSTFVGRTVELGSVAVARRRRVAGERVCVSVRAGSGMGKTAFCDAVAKEATAGSWFVVRAAAPSLAVPYGVVVDVVERVLVERRAACAGLDDHARRVLATLTPMAAPAEPPEGPVTRHQIVGALRRLLLLAACEQPCLVIVDDLHLADDDGIEVIAHLAHAPGPLLVVMAHTGRRNGALHDALVRLARAGVALEVPLGPLDDGSAALLVDTVAPVRLVPATRARIVASAAGHPTVLSELASRPSDTSGGATDVSTVLAARLISLPEPERRVLARVGLAGSEPDWTAAWALSGIDEQGTSAVLDLALDNGVLQVRGIRYGFANEVLRHALVASLAPHERVAAHLEAAARHDRAGSPPAEVAAHLLAAGRPDDATPYLLAAARAAMAVSAFANVLAHVATVLRHEPRHPEARRLRAEAMDASGDLGTLAAYDAAIEVASHDDRDDLRAKRALAQVKTGDPVGALQAIAGARPRSIDGRLSEALTYSGAAALGFGDPATGTAKAAEMRRLALATGDRASIVIASWANAAAAHARGALRDSVLADLRDTADLPHLAVRVFDGHLCITQRFLYGARPYDDVIAFADRLAAEALALGASRGHAFGIVLRGEAELLAGRLDDAAHDLLEGGRLHRAIGGPTGEALSVQRLAELAIHRGEPERAADLIDEALELARSTDIGFHLLDRIYGTRLVLATHHGDPLAALADAEHAVRGPLETCPGCRITFAVPAGIAAARGADLETARRYEHAATYLADVVMRLPAWHAALAELRGHVASASGDGHAAATHFRDASRRFAAAGQPLDAARCEGFAER